VSACVGETKGPTLCSVRVGIQSTTARQHSALKPRVKRNSERVLVFHTKFSFCHSGAKSLKTCIESYSKLLPKALLFERSSVNYVLSLGKLSTFK
jgi:hypothetical protein